MKTSYVKYEDPGHGWLRVEREELHRLGIEDEISPYSYQSKDAKFVFLEEDSDMEKFMEAKLAIDKVEITLHCKSANNQSKIRTYRSYTHVNAATNWPAKGAL
jgi:hypothetical protein